MTLTALRFLACALMMLPFAARGDETPAHNVLISAFEAGGCQLTTEALDTAFADAGLTQKDSTEEIIQLANVGAVAFSADGQIAYLTTGDTCDDFAVPEIEVDSKARAALIALFEKNDCALPMAGPSLDPLRTKFSNAQIDAALASLIADKALVFENRVSTLTVGPACGARAK